MSIDYIDRHKMAEDVHGYIQENFEDADLVFVICSHQYMQDTGIEHFKQSKYQNRNYSLTSSLLST